MGRSDRGTFSDEIEGAGSTRGGGADVKNTVKRVLVVYYSQSGQAYEIVRSIVDPLQESRTVEVVWEELQPVTPYPFPWPFLKLLDTLPESVCMDPPLLKPCSFDPGTKFDLVLLGYQVWYLSPSLPVTGFLKSPYAKVFEKTPVITIVSSRDKWLMAQEKVKACLDKIGAKLLDNIAFTESGNQVLTLVSSVRWIITGKREALGKFLPRAGIGEENIKKARRFGTAILHALESGTIDKGEPILKGLGAVKVDPNLIRPEQAAHRNFLFWAKLIRAVGKQGQKRRIPFLVLFLIALPCLVVLSLPFALIIRAVDGLRKEALQSMVDYFERPSGSSTERLEDISLTKTWS